MRLTAAHSTGRAQRIHTKAPSAGSKRKSICVCFVFVVLFIVFLHLSDLGSPRVVFSPRGRPPGRGFGVATGGAENDIMTSQLLAKGEGVFSFISNDRAWSSFLFSCQRRRLPPSLSPSCRPPPPRACCTRMGKNRDTLLSTLLRTLTLIRNEFEQSKSTAAAAPRPRSRAVVASSSTTTTTTTNNAAEARAWIEAW